MHHHLSACHGARRSAGSQQAYRELKGRYADSIDDLQAAGLLHERTIRPCEMSMAARAEAISAEVAEAMASAGSEPRACTEPDDPSEFVVAAVAASGETVSVRDDRLVAFTTSSRSHGDT